MVIDATAAMRARSGYFTPPAPRVLAHRGLAIDAPENTLLAFVKALSLGVTHIETDVHATRDGVAVISHDADLARLTGRDIRIDSLSLAELAEIRLGQGQRIPTLAAALEAFPSARFNIDIKCAGAVRPTAQAIIATKSVDRVLVASFSERRRRAAVRLLPGVATSASSSLFVLALVAANLRLDSLARWALRGVDAVQVPKSYLGVRIVTGRMVRVMHSARVEVHVWTINDADDMRRLLDLGVDGLVTDRADLAMTVLAGRSAR